MKVPEEVALSAAVRLQSLRALDGAWRVACTRAKRSHRLESHRGPSTTGGVARDSGSVRGQRTAAEQGTVCFLTPLTTVRWKVQQARRVSRGNCPVRPSTKLHDSAACVVTAHRLAIREELRIQQHVHISLEGGSLHAMHGDRKPARGTWFDAQYAEATDCSGGAAERRGIF